MKRLLPKMSSIQIPVSRQSNEALTDFPELACIEARFVAMLLQTT